MPKKKKPKSQTAKQNLKRKIKLKPDSNVAKRQRKMKKIMDQLDK